MKTEPLIPTHPPQQQQARDYLTAVYLDWRNNWLSVGRFAESHGITETQAAELIATARDVFNTEDPDA